MKPLRLAALVLVPLIAAGCDVALGAYLASRKDSKKTPLGPPSPETRFSLWVANLSAGVLTDAQVRQAIIDGGGEPTGEWTKVGNFSQTTEFDATAVPPGTWDSVLLLATDKQSYEVDAIEVLDATGSTIAKGTGSNLFSNNLSDLTQVQGSPNGLTTSTTATATDLAFVFLHHSSPITRARVSAGVVDTFASGDVVWTFTHSFPNDQFAGGADVNSAGVTYLTLREASTIGLLRISSDGVVIKDDHVPARDVTTVSNVTTPSGHSSVAIDLINHATAPAPSTVDNVYLAVTEDAGDIRLFMFQTNKETAEWTFPAQFGAGVDRVEPNGLVLDSNGDLILAGGFDAQGANKVQHYIRKHNKGNGADMWGASPPPTAPFDTTDSYWYSVATTGGNSIIAGGNVSPSLGLLPGINIRNQRLLDNSPASVTETWDVNLDNGGSTNGIGRAVGVDGAGNVYVGGFFTHAGDNDSIIIRYTGGTTVDTVHFPPALLPNRTGNDEILDVAVDPDGTLYAVGYETNGAQAGDLVLYKIAATGEVAWKRTVHENGNDRGVSVVSTPTHVIVVGELEVSAGNKDIHVRKYVK